MVKAPPLSQPLLEGADEVEAAGSSNKYLKSLWAQLCLRFIMNLTITIVLPTLPEYMTAVGGTVSDYYLAGAGFSTCQFLGVTLVGIYMDHGDNRFLTVYRSTMVLASFSYFLYAIAGSVSFLRGPGVLIFARCLAGLSMSNTLLLFIYIGKTLQDKERMEWVVRFGMTRSQGIFWGPAFGMLLSLISTSDTGLWGAKTLPGWFCLVTVILGSTAVFFTWEDVPTARRTARDDNATQSSQLSLRDFLSHTEVLSVVGVISSVALSVSLAEYVMPVLTAAALGWRGAVCGLPLVVMAVSLFMGQLFLISLTRRGVKDVNIVSFSVLVYPTVLLSAVVVWKMALPESLGIASALWSFVLTPPLGACGVLGGQTVYSRLAASRLSGNMGSAMAFFTNAMAIANLSGPLLLKLTYSGKLLEEDKVPMASFLVLFACQLVTSTWFLCTKSRMKGRERSMSACSDRSLGGM